ncbi:MAG: transcription termination factor Rho [Pirellulaceae bacterium]|nr:transcription termination factor Rho [Pirellulaceae bacterium]
MAKKKRFRPRTTGGPSTHGGNRDTGRDSNRGSSGYSSNTPGGGAGRRRPPANRRRNEYGSSTSNDSFPEPALDENGEIALVEFAGVLEMHPNGYGFLRSADNNYSRERTDPFVPGTMIEKFGLRQGLLIKSMMQPGRRQQGPRVREIMDVDGMKPEDYINVKFFDDDKALTPINPEQWLHLETGPEPLTNRIIDLLAPFGKGQRALIVAPPRTGKTIMLQHISRGIALNHPEVTLLVLLIDERPEEVTDMKRNVINGEVIASSLDMDVDSHVRLSQLVIDRCKRLAEMGKDVFLLMDSITRLARAFNKWVGSNGPTMSGGVNIKAMDIPKRLFATARAFAEGGSLTIVGTALIDTGSRMDDLIFQEFKGTGNMELVLDRRLAERRVWPAIDISLSGTRREELLHDEETLNAVTMLRRTLNTMHPVEAMEQLTKQLGRFKSNKEFIRLISAAKVLD